MKLKFVGMGGSFRPKSSSSKALAVPLNYLKERGHDTNLLLFPILNSQDLKHATNLRIIPKVFDTCLMKSVRPMD